MAGVEAVHDALARAATPQEACSVVVAHLGDTLGLMPSVYLASADRLRLMEARGYWQVYDGMPATAESRGRRRGRRATAARLLRDGDEKINGASATQCDHRHVVHHLHAYDAL